MSDSRLTPNELDWLLALEAKEAAKTLKSDLSDLLRQNAPPSSTSGSGARLLLGTLPEFDHLGRTRRGRLDLAALLLEIAPHCRLAIEPGSGTELVGNEADLRRALQLMLASDPESTEGTVEVRREKDWIRVSVELGPDLGFLHESERRWLHRVAIRHGGRYEVRGATQSLVLPADASAQAEIEALQHELEQAKQLGESYARELASVVTELEQLRSQLRKYQTSNGPTQSTDPQ